MRAPKCTAYFWETSPCIIGIGLLPHAQPREQGEEYLVGRLRRCKRMHARGECLQVTLRRVRDGWEEDLGAYLRCT